MTLLYSFVFAGLMFVLFNLLYRFMLCRSPYLGLNRLFLFLIPIITLLTVQVKTSYFGLDNVAIIELPAVEIQPSGEQSAESESPIFSLFSAAMSVYAIGFLFMLMRLVRSAYRNIRFIKNAEGKQLHGISCLYRPGARYTFNFFGYIVVHSLDVSKKTLVHEQAHSTMYHYVDLLWAELWCCVFWCFPFAQSYSRNVELNNEYSADRIAAGSDRKTYQNELVAAALNVKPELLTQSFFNQSLIKNRIVMLQKQKKNPLLTVLRYSASVTLFAVGIYGFNAFSQVVEDLETQESTTSTDSEPEIYQKVEHMPQFPGGDPELFNYLGENVEYPEKAKKEGIEEVVYTSFVISDEGKVTRVEILRGDEVFHESALNAIKGMPDWEPGRTKEGEAVHVQYRIPLRYQLNNEKEE